MSREAYLPIFFGDFLSSTVYWRGEEKGLYLLLLGYQWSSGPLPADLETLSQVVGYDYPHFRKLWERVGKKFVQTTNGLINLRLEEHRAKSHQISGKRAAIGSKGGTVSAAKRAAKRQAIGSTLVDCLASKRSSKFQPSNPIQSNPNEEEESEAYQGEERREALR